MFVFPFVFQIYFTICFFDIFWLKIIFYVENIFWLAHWQLWPIANRRINCNSKRKFCFIPLDLIIILLCVSVFKTFYYIFFYVINMEVPLILSDFSVRKDSVRIFFRSSDNFITRSNLRLLNGLRILTSANVVDDYIYVRFKFRKEKKNK